MAKKQILPEKKKKKKETTPQLDSAAARLVKMNAHWHLDPKKKFARLSRHPLQSLHQLLVAIQMFSFHIMRKL